MDFLESFFLSRVNEPDWSKTGTRSMEALGQARSSQHLAEVTGDQVLQLQQRVDRLSVVNLALWRLLQDRLGLTDEQLRESLTQLQNESAKNKVVSGTKPEGRCPGCGHVNAMRKDRCMYCGHQDPAGIEAFAG